MQATALIAEDEPLLAAALQAELQRLWPQLTIAATVGDGASAVRQALALRPDICFLDVRMPGMNGLDAAHTLAEEWAELPPDAPTLPLLVFATAYDQYAVQAFEAQAVDYLLKPVDARRLAATVERLQAHLQARARARSAAPDPTPSGATADTALWQAVEQLRALAGATAAAPRLQVLQVGVGSAVQMVPVGEVLYFEAADKYLRVVTAEHDYLIRLSLRELLPQLDGQQFWQVHRGTVVQASAIDRALRDEAGRVTLSLRGRPEKLQVSRVYAPRFKPM